MLNRRVCQRTTRLLAVLIFLACSQSRTLLSQDTQDPPVKVNDFDRSQASQATGIFRHAKPSHQDPKARFSDVHQPSNPSFATRSDDDGRDYQVAYPGDLTNHGGPVVYTAQSHAVYLLQKGTCTIASCWGDPEGFLSSLANSRFISLVNQYTAYAGTGRYALGKPSAVAFTPSKTPLTDADVLAIVHAVASSTGKSGYGNIFHIFLPPGQDECFDSTYTQCYSPDHLSSFVFCAYHSSGDFKDVGHVLYTVEPYQNVSGCQVRPGTPNGQLVDSTNDVLSHELFETITDPDGTAWFNTMSGALYGQEIGDECTFLTPDYYSKPFVYRMNDQLFATQPEYSNAIHGCAVN